MTTLRNFRPLQNFLLPLQQPNDHLLLLNPMHLPLLVYHSQGKYHKTAEEHPERNSVVIILQFHQSHCKVVQSQPYNMRDKDEDGSEIVFVVGCGVALIEKFRFCYKLFTPISDQ